MSIDRLREELARISDEAPVVEVPRDTWTRAARARTRDRVLAAGGAVAAIALVAGLVAWLPDRLEAPVAAGGDGAVPDRIWSVPARMAEREGDPATWSQDLERDLAIGPGAVAFVMEEGLPVVVDAADGDYHLLDLPGFVGNDEFLAVSSRTLSERPLALSPDGRRLAYAYAAIGPEAASEPVPTGIRVVDLTSGDVRQIPITGSEGTLVESFSWSPDGRWLTWRGQQHLSWTQFSLGGATPVAGLVGPNADTSTELPTMNGNARVSYAVDDDGTVAVVGDSRVLLVDDTGVERIQLDPDAGFSVAAEYVDGTLHDVRMNGTTPGYSVHNLSGPKAVTLPDGTPSSAGMIPEGGLADRDVQPLGWIDEQHLLAEVTGPFGDDVERPDSELALIGVGDDPTYDVVGTVDGDVPALSVATDLVSLEQPTVERPEPDWPWTTERWLVTLGLAAVALLGGVLLFVRQRRSAR